ncbi:hypothetical protein MTBBW1_410045 [Desulfamplus magnetovallimortis]|uniref:Uncharacterized protein n=1 Tax=Desulfamplus magnetovallimortis TaxID=1246637 RepID=A0A1W1HGV9_9BACT|nr:hypothetical protein MTBBW1_410045 [Desulfamplus magnetovallimortis]
MIAGPPEFDFDRFKSPSGEYHIERVPNSLNFGANVEPAPTN